LAAELIAIAYRGRWTVELFFSGWATEEELITYLERMRHKAT
jgi:hypothetical protein